MSFLWIAVVIFLAFGFIRTSIKLLKFLFIVGVFVGVLLLLSSLGLF